MKRIRKTESGVARQLDFGPESPLENDNQHLPMNDDDLISREDAFNLASGDSQGISVQSESSAVVTEDFGAAEGPAEEGTTEGESLEDLREKIERLESEYAGKTAENALLNQIVEKMKTELENQAKEMGTLKDKVKTASIVPEAENLLLKKELEELKKKLSGSEEIFLFSKISHSSQLVEHFTGLPNKETFFALLKLCKNFDVKYHKWKVLKLDMETQLFMTLLKLRRGLSNCDLSVRFKIGVDSVSNIFISWIMLLHHVLVKNLMANIPSKERNAQNSPESFLDYPSTRIILDCTEVSSSNPTLMSNQCKMYSPYKHKITSKGLVGCAPNGTVTFVSKLYPGSTSDRNIVIDSGVLSLCVPGDTVMADKGFNITDIMPNGVTLNIPPFKDTPQFTAEQVQETFEVARARIHIERVINRIKRFRILDFIPQFLGLYASEVFQVYAALTNFKKPLIKECAEDSSDD